MHPLGFAASLDEATKWISSRRPGPGVYLALFEGGTVFMIGHFRSTNTTMRDTQKTITDFPFMHVLFGIQEV